MSEIVSIPSEGATLSGTLFRPDGDIAAALIIHPAVGAPQGFYRAFAEWAASEGRLCLTYDYRDMGASATGPLRASKAGFVDWGSAGPYLAVLVTPITFVVDVVTAPIHVAWIFATAGGHGDTWLPWCGD